MMRLSFFISLFISLFGIFIIQNLFGSNADDPSQNTFLGLVGITFVAPFILLSLFITYRYFFTLVKNANDRFLQLTFVFGSLLLLVFLAYYSFKYKVQVVGDKTYSFPPLNEKTYQVYFNFYTFAFVHTVSAFLASIFGITKKEKE